MRLKPQQYWAIIITLLFHTVLFWGLFFVEMNKKNTADLYELEVQEDSKITEEKEQKLEEIRKIAEEQLQEELSNKASKKFLKGEKRPTQKVVSNAKQLEQEFEERKQKTDALKKAFSKPEISLEKKKSPIQEQQQDTISKQTVFYVGSSRVEYFLAERYRIHLPIPAYQCEGAGSVEVLIWVNRDGRVVEAKIEKFRSNSATDCMRESALKASLSSLFSKRPQASTMQKGRIVYLFAKQ